MSAPDPDRPPHWIKITDPDTVVEPQIGTDVRVLLPTGPEFAPLREKLHADGIPNRDVRYLVEQETITPSTHGDALTSTNDECCLLRSLPRRFPTTTGTAAQLAKDSFALLWDDQADESEPRSRPVNTADVVPGEWLRYLPHDTLNPAQAEAAPHLLDGLEHLMVVAPTGSGKTVTGMLAALRTVLGQRRKAAWLVPQRSLTDELDQQLDAWRQQGLRVERLSGEYSVDIDRVREADLWVATTEKFEAICRASSFREALGEVGCLIVDEIHLLGDPTRGPVLEALLSRVHDGEQRMRVVGLSATVSNAENLARWLGARLVRTKWRPSKLTWQLPTISAHADFSQTEAARTRLASALTGMVTSDGGSVLVFCGSKRGVRQTALIIAGSRGIKTDGVRPDDLDALHAVCTAGGIGLHYKGWEHKRESERAFRARELDVLVATTTVAAGVNLPARAVVIRDTQVGLNDIDVATVQQMFGRAGRVGKGESQGWAFLIVDDTERHRWLGKLTAGHKVDSQILSSLPDHVLAEAVQQRIGSLRQAERWWVGTLAHHQGNRSLAPLRQAVDFLVQGNYLSAEQSDDDLILRPTELGTLTARIMVSTTVGDELRSALAGVAMPATPRDAEVTLINTVSALVPKLAHASISEELKSTVISVLNDHGRVGHEYLPGDLARATLLIAATRPTVFGTAARHVDGLPHTAMYPVLEEAPRYLHWLGTQGYLGTVHPWCAIVAADLAKRITWRRGGPTRGSGRLLWMCEQMATAQHADSTVLPLWTAATAKGFTSPDWTATGRPRQCRLDDNEYQALLRDRASTVQVRLREHRITATGPVGSVLISWSGSQHWRTPLRGGQIDTVRPDTEDFASDDTHSTPRKGADAGAVVFTWRGDFHATGWLADYHRAHPAEATDGTS